MSGRKKANSKNNRIDNFIKIQIVNLTVYLAVFLIMCLISVGFDISADRMIYVSVGFIGLSSFLSGFISGIKGRKNGMTRGIISALPLNVIFVIISFVLNGLKPDISILITLVICLVMSAVGGIISVNIRLK